MMLKFSSFLSYANALVLILLLWSFYQHLGGDLELQPTPVSVIIS
jgi:hypothetical protein